MKFGFCLALTAFFSAAQAESDYYEMTLQTDCGCEPGTYDIYVRRGSMINGKYEIFHKTSNGTVKIPRSNDDLPLYKRITGVAVVTRAYRPTPTRLTKYCPGMPHLPEQGNYTPVSEGGIIEIYCTEP